MLVSHPVVALLSQSPYPALQAETAHAPAAQVAVPFWIAQGLQSFDAHPYAGSLNVTQKPPQSFRVSAHLPELSGGTRVVSAPPSSVAVLASRL